jgi:hypothetical protein
MGRKKKWMDVMSKSPTIPVKILFCVKDYTAIQPFNDQIRRTYERGKKWNDFVTYPPSTTPDDIKPFEFV